MCSWHCVVNSLQHYFPLFLLIPKKLPPSKQRLVGEVCLMNKIRKCIQLLFSQISGVYALGTSEIINYSKPGVF